MQLHLLPAPNTPSPVLFNLKSKEEREAVQIEILLVASHRIAKISLFCFDGYTADKDNALVVIGPFFLFCCVELP